MKEQYHISKWIFQTMESKSNHLLPIIVSAQSTLDKMANLLKKPDNQVVAAINGTFFSAYDGNPVPWGTIGKKGEVIHIGNYGTQIGIDAQNKVLIEHIDTAVEGSINGVQDRWYAWNLNHSYDNAEAVAILTPVPSRFVAESLGLKVDWSQENYSVIITTEIDKLT